MKHLYYTVIFIILFWIGLNATKTINATDRKLNNKRDNINIDTSYSSTHNTYNSRDKIEYIIIHYVAGTTSKKGSAIDTANWFKNPECEGSADFIVDDELFIQYNPNPEKYATWAVGGIKLNTEGGSMHGIIKNKNSISIEICNNNSNCKTPPANDKSYYFSTKAVNNAIRLTKYLMEKYNIPASNVYRHYDVTGKLCPGIIGWNKESGSEEDWMSFKAELESTDVASISSYPNSEHSEGNKCNNLEFDSDQYKDQKDGAKNLKYLSFLNIFIVVISVMFWQLHTMY